MKLSIFFKNSCSIYEFMFMYCVFVALTLRPTVFPLFSKTFSSISEFLLESKNITRSSA